MLPGVAHHMLAEVILIFFGGWERLGVIRSARTPRFYIRGARVPSELTDLEFQDPRLLVD